MCILKIDDLLKIENSKEILDYRFTRSNIPMYLTIRFILIQSIINKEFALSNPHIKLKKYSFGNKMAYIFQTLKNNLFFAPKKDIYIFSSGIVNDFRDGKYVNRLYDSFYSIYSKQTQILESSNKRNYLTPKKQKICYRDLIDISISVFSKFCILKKDDKENIDKLLECIKKNSKFKIDDKDFLEIKNNLKNTSKKIGISILLYKIFFKIKKPKLIIVEDAHYGSCSYIIKVAKELGIKTAEYQHGYIGLAHPAYNFNDSLNCNELKTCLPDFFLTHGEYWSEHCRVFSKKISIGYPTLIDRIQKYNKKITKTNKILFISGGTVPKQLNKIIDSTINDGLLKGYKYYLRPHPSELPSVKSRYGNLILNNVNINEGDLYEILSEVDIVIALEVSTVIFEAINFTKKVYLMNTKYTSFYEPNSKFIKFDNTDELVSLINKNTEMDFNPEYFWKIDWKVSYEKFIKKILEI